MPLLLDISSFLKNPAKSIGSRPRPPRLSVSHHVSSSLSQEYFQTLPPTPAQPRPQLLNPVVLVITLDGGNDSSEDRSGIKFAAFMNGTDPMLWRTTAGTLPASPGCPCRLASLRHCRPVRRSWLACYRVGGADCHSHARIHRGFGVDRWRGG